MKNETVTLTEGLMNYQEFKQIMFTEFQGLDPEYDIYYWNLWNDTLRSHPNADWNEFLNAIAMEKI